MYLLNKLKKIVGSGILWFLEWEIDQDNQNGNRRKDNSLWTPNEIFTWLYTNYTFLAMVPELFVTKTMLWRSTFWCKDPRSVSPPTSWCRKGGDNKWERRVHIVCISWEWLTNNFHGNITPNIWPSWIHWTTTDRLSSRRKSTRSTITTRTRWLPYVFIDMMAKMNDPTLTTPDLLINSFF